MSPPPARARRVRTSFSATRALTFSVPAMSSAEWLVPDGKGAYTVGNQCVSLWLFSTGGPDTLYAVFCILGLMNTHSRIQADGGPAMFYALVDWRNFFFVQTLAGLSAAFGDHMWRMLACLGYVSPCDDSTVCFVESVIATTTSAAANLSIGLAYMNFGLDFKHWFFIVSILVLLSDNYAQYMGQQIQQSEMNMAYLGMMALTPLAIVLRRTNWVFAVIFAGIIGAMAFGGMTASWSLHLVIVYYCAAWAAATAFTLGADKPRLWPQVASSGPMF